MFRRTGIMVAAVAIAAAVLTPVAVGSAAAASAPYCGITWGSQPKLVNPSTWPQLTNVRAGRHDCYDRLVFDFQGPDITGSWVNYVTTMTADGSGQVVPLRGGAKLSVVLHAPAYDDEGQPTYHVANGPELVNVSGYRTFRQVAWAGSFEGMTSVGLGVRARLPFRAFTLPGRLIVDVAHAW
jgi:hypothetical protein